MSLSSCGDESENLEPQNGELVKSLSATVSDFEMDEDEMTRTSYVVSSTEGFVFSWALGDTLGIYPVGGNQVDFPISDGIGTKIAMFDGGSWALRSSYTYAGYYPYSANHYHNPQTAIPVNYAGQKQSGNNNLNGLSDYDFMAAAPVGATLSGGVNLDLKHLGSFVRFQLTMPSASNYTSLTLTSSDVQFIETATFDLTSDAPALTPKTYSEKFTLALENISTTLANQVITLYAMIAPVNQKTANNITVRVADDKGNTYSVVTTGKNLVAGKSYNYSLVLEGDGSAGGSGEDAGWDSDDDPFNGHEYVDLGLKNAQGKTIYWAKCNVGATKPYEYGDYFAWGETEPKSEYSWENYKYAVFVEGTPAEYDADGFLIKPATEVHYEGLNIGEDISGTQYDAARQNWGGNWRMPTEDDLVQLKNDCIWTWTQMLTAESKPINGYKVTGPNGNWIFFPAAGCRYNTDLTNDGSRGYYRSSTPYPYGPNYADYLYFDSSGISPDYCNFRYCGQSVRPVTE